MFLNLIFKKIMSFDRYVSQKNFALCDCVVTGFRLEMVIVLSESKCPICGKPRVKNPDCGGDYYSTVAGYRLQEYCNGDCIRNGVLIPQLAGEDPDHISGHGKERFAVRVAYAKKLGVIHTKKIARSCESNIPGEFLNMFAEKTRFSVSEISSFLG